MLSVDKPCLGAQVLSEHEDQSRITTAADFRVNVVIQTVFCQRLNIHGQLEIIHPDNFCSARMSSNFLVFDYAWLDVLNFAVALRKLIFGLD